MNQVLLGARILSFIPHLIILGGLNIFFFLLDINLITVFNHHRTTLHSVNDI